MVFGLSAPALERSSEVCMLLTILGAIGALVLGAVAGTILAFISAFVVLVAVWRSSSDSSAELFDVFHWFLPASPMMALFAVLAALVGSTYPMFLVGLGTGFCVLLAFQSGRAYQKNV